MVPGRIDIRAEGLAIEAQIGWGRPAVGRIVIAVEAPDAEIPASRIDVSASGAILVVGARLDMEAMSRARAIGVAAVISGGVASRHLRQLALVRGPAAGRHPCARRPFALLAMGGYGRVPIPRHLWDLLVAADGRPAGIHAESRTLIIGGDPRPLLAAVARPPGTVRVLSGEARDQEGRLVGLSGPASLAGRHLCARRLRRDRRRRRAHTRAPACRSRRWSASAEAGPGRDVESSACASHDVAGCHRVP